MKPKKVAPLLVLAVIWGCYYVASQQTIKGFSEEGHMSQFPTGIIIRFITMILLGVIMWRRDELKLLLKVQGILPRLLMIGVLGFLLDITAFIGLSLSPAGSGTALLKTDIIFVNLISMMIYKTKFKKLDWLFSLVMLFGVFLVMGVDFTNFSIGNVGSIFFILSALFVSINAFVIKSVQLDKHNPAADNVIAFYNNFVTMIFFIAAAIIHNDFSLIGKLSGDWKLVIAALCAGLGQTGIYLVYYYDLRRFPVWIVKVFLLLMPIVSTLVSLVLFGEKMTINQVLGMFVVLAGAFGILILQKKKSEQGEDAMAGH
ncbi:MAG: DMT family transporter [Clostridiales bacterium]|nr:DMT family transporter [Clostridiales bacterium]MDY3747502.1 DMT family transporter [Lachnospiraceae bacterium]